MELAAALLDALRYGDLGGHLAAWRNVQSGAVTPATRAGDDRQAVSAALQAAWQASRALLAADPGNGDGERAAWAARTIGYCAKTLADTYNMPEAAR